VKRKTFHIVSLGCAKNTVDADSMAVLLCRAGYRLITSPNQAHIIIINTCGFINTAKDDSYRTLESFAQNKKEKQLLIAAGCLTQRYGEMVIQRIPQIDAIIGTRDWQNIVGMVNNLCQNNETSDDTSSNNAPQNSCSVPRYSIQGASAYLKIADGCSRKCSFCAIPSIKGPAVSRPLQQILDEARQLQELGIKELVLIAQNSTDYGHDIGIKNGLVRLLKELTLVVPDINWLRIMYAYPGFVTDELIELMSESKQIVPYLDMPLQHSHPDVLRSMQRPANMEWVYKTLSKMRQVIPGLALRSTFIVGYPNENEEHFQSLLDFIQEIRFDKLGAFKFSYEPGTPSAVLGDPISERTKEERLGKLMAMQQQISRELNINCIGKTLHVLIEGSDDGISVGRSYRDAPEVDGLVIVKGVVPVGSFLPVRITEATEYDLFGEV